MAFPVSYKLQRPRLKLGDMLRRIVGWEHAHIIVTFSDGSTRELSGDIALVLAESLDPWLEALVSYVEAHPCPVDFRRLSPERRARMVQDALEEGGSYLEF